MLVTLLTEEPMYIQSDGITITINGYASVIVADLTTYNGVVHVVDKVILPPGETVSVGEIQNTQSLQNNIYYNIMGQEIRSYEDIPLNGFYITNGRKFIKTVE